MSQSKSGPPAHYLEEDFESIEAAVMETARGRWFLAEFARRNRVADTDMLLAAIRKLQNAVIERAPPDMQDAVRQSVMEMANDIAQARGAISDLKLDQGGGGGIPGATDALDGVVEGTEKATSDILHAAEQMQEIAWKLRETGSAEALCEALDAHATDIYTACSFQDLTGQRIRHVIAVLHRIEARLDGLIRDWGLDDIGRGESDRRATDAPGERIAPAPAGNSQADVDLLMIEPGDIVFAERRPAAPAALPPYARGTGEDGVADAGARDGPERPSPAAPAGERMADAVPRSDGAPGAASAPDTGPGKGASCRLDALSPAQRMALFS